MAKAGRQSLSPFLIGFLLVLVAAEITYVHGDCDVGEYVRVHLCRDADCNSLCISASSFLVSHTLCGVVDESGHAYCLCCR
ncbi:hypothetical protein MKW94_026655 [Papaver nudicaule]|uniref:Uncharacterized protein n=1 Tax=Papaver nudicaule TaxID=74823 RepID=A0AA41VJD7_PAPNU|nr:hypothetical protein [Papaver nudicaule]